MILLLLSVLLELIYYGAIFIQLKQKGFRKKIIKK